MKSRITSFGLSIALCALVLGLASTAYSRDPAPKLTRVRAGEHPKAYAGLRGNGANRSQLSGSFLRPSRGMASPEDQFKGLFNTSPDRQK